MDFKIIVVIASFLFLFFSTLRMFYGLALMISIALGIKPLLKKINSQYKPSLQKYFTFYNNLNAKDKDTFERRVQLFIDLKTFIPRGGLKKITPEMKAIIAGSAVQLTFGFKNVYFRYFRRILVFPDIYFNRITKQYHKGEVNGRGIIVLSYNNLIKGFENNSDGINLGLHEMSHALQLENLVKNKEFDFLDKNALEEFKTEARKEILKIKNGENNLYRNYGSANFAEFFAVSIELFFEKPQNLYQYNSKLYTTIAAILNLNPMKII